MIGSSLLGGLVFECPIQCFLAAFDVLIKISESYQPQIPTVESEPGFYLLRAFQQAQKHPKWMRNEGDMVISKMDHERKKKEERKIFFFTWSLPSPLFWCRMGLGSPFLPWGGPPPSLSHVGQRKMKKK